MRFTTSTMKIIYLSTLYVNMSHVIALFVQMLVSRFVIAQRKRKNFSSEILER